jgi:hypothetical protein
MVYFVRRKDDIPLKIIEFHEMVCALGHEIKLLKSGNGGEFVSERVKLDTMTLFESI